MITLRKVRVLVLTSVFLFGAIYFLISTDHLQWNSHTSSLDKHVMKETHLNLILFTPALKESKMNLPAFKDFMRKPVRNLSLFKHYNTEPEGNLSLFTHYKTEPEGNLSLFTHYKTEPEGNLSLFTHYKTEPEGNLSLFTHVMNETEVDIFLSLLDAFHDAMKRNEIPYFISSGTLLGSWRHHGFIPWDDDLDVSVPKEQRQLIHIVLSRLEPQFLLADIANVRWKFYSERSRPVQRYKWRWPYIDIFFYNTNETHVYEEDPAFRSTNTFRKEVVFPLRDRPFMHRLFPAPLKPEVIFNISKFNPDMCIIYPYDHSREAIKPNFMNNFKKRVQCKDLEKYFLFVRRVKMENGHGCNETLVENGTKVVSWFYCESCTC